MRTRRRDPGGPLAGVRVLDVGGPAGVAVARLLADAGAAVVRLASDDDTREADARGRMAILQVAAGTAGGRALVRRLAAASDAIILSAAMEERASLAREGIGDAPGDPVVLETGAPEHPGALAAFSGIAHLTGWPDAAPQVPAGDGPQSFVAAMGALAVVAALDHRRRTGHGQLIRLNPLAALAHALGPVMLDWTVNARAAGRHGDRDPDAAPHGAWPCKDGRWIAISCTTGQQWEAFRAVTGRPDWCDLERMRRKRQRLDHQKEIDYHFAFWCLERTAGQALETLQQFGVPAGVVRTPEDVLRDPQLRHRRHAGTTAPGGAPGHHHRAFRFSRDGSGAPPASAGGRAVLQTILGLSDGEVAAFEAQGVVRFVD